MSRDMFLLPPGKLLEMVTIDAAKALGWDDEIGSLEVGQEGRRGDRRTCASRT